MYRDGVQSLSAMKTNLSIDDCVIGKFTANQGKIQRYCNRTTGVISPLKIHIERRGLTMGLPRFDQVYLLFVLHWMGSHVSFRNVSYEFVAVFTDWI